MISALPPKADSSRTSRDVRFVPTAEVADLVRSPCRRGRAAWRDCEAERFSGLEIDKQLKFRGLLTLPRLERLSGVTTACLTAFLGQLI
jgi:hypothetical protein